MTELESGEDPPLDLFDDAKTYITSMLDRFCDNYKHSQYWRTLVSMKPRVLVNTEAGYRYDWSNKFEYEQHEPGKPISTPYELSYMATSHRHTEDHGVRLKLPKVGP